MSHPLTIEQNATEIIIQATGLHEGRPIETYRLDGSANIYDHDFGPYWVRAKTHATWEGAALIVTTNQVAGWWKDGGPEAANIDGSKKQTIRVFRVDASSKRMTVVSTVNYGTFTDVVGEELNCPWVCDWNNYHTS